MHCQCEGDTDHGKQGHCYETATCHVKRPAAVYKQAIDGHEHTTRVATLNLCTRCGLHYKSRGYNVLLGVNER